MIIILCYLHGKLTSLNAEVNSIKAKIITLQETHYKEKGKIKLNKDFVVFQAIRVKKGGGTAIAIHEDLKPKLIEEHSDEYELLVVDIKPKDKDIRIMSGYGPQENIEEDKICFTQYLPSLPPSLSSSSQDLGPENWIFCTKWKYT